MSELETPLRSGRGPSGSATSDVALADVALADVALAEEDLAGEDLAGEGEDLAGEDLAGEADAEVTATVCVAEGGIHFSVVTTLAVAVSCTELTEVAPAATGIWALRSTGCWSDTEPTLHVAVLSPLAQPLVNVGFWLDGCAVSVTATPVADPFSVETATTNAAF